VIDHENVETAAEGTQRFGDRLGRSTRRAEVTADGGATCASAGGLRLRYPTATFAPARASITAVARPMPRPPPVTNARSR